MEWWLMQQTAKTEPEELSNYSQQTVREDKQ